MEAPGSYREACRRMVDELTSCPVQSKPWAEGASEVDAKTALAAARARHPDCARLHGGGVCHACLRDVIGFRLPEKDRR